ncbi:MAG: hypothetical protein GF381_04695 [Candidatus Pacebacteria bacterium]|nr:hypothetical protein [Candidatus Paceibacterota bacterium]
MLSKQNRLNLALEESRTIFHNSKKLHSPDFICFYRPARRFKAAVVIPKKFTKLAVKRNQVKRKVYQQIKEVFLTDQEPANFELVVLQKTQLKTNWEQALKSTFQKLVDEVVRKEEGCRGGK